MKPGPKSFTTDLCIYRFELLTKGFEPDDIPLNDYEGGFEELLNLKAEEQLRMREESSIHSQGFDLAMHYFSWGPNNNYPNTSGSFEFDKNLLDFLSARSAQPRSPQPYLKLSPTVRLEASSSQSL
ncbi:hypothetical protein ACH5RR_020246 [Cinchona calisaya]|uniref:Uncharacterized protein n=1 Tax=Cinchona calisaya TaxID=153742 RepID=A0ABD2ZGW2_9GENT